MGAIKLSLLFLVYIVTTCQSSYAEVFGELKIKNVERTIDLKSQLVKITSKVTIENVGKAPVKYFFVPLEVSPDKIAYVGVKDSNVKELRMSESKIPGYNSVLFYRADLKTPLNAGSTTILLCEVVLTQSLEPFPTAITQSEDQYVRYYGNLYFYTPYHVATQKTSLVMNTKSVESFTKVKPFTQNDNSITYGPYSSVEPFSIKEIAVHYLNNAPFLTVSRVERLIEVSHWGNVAIEEVIEVHHSGAKLKGPFSRYDYQQDHYSGPNSVRSYKTSLPASASDVYYRDSNGNISTSNMKVKKDSVELELRPRYPLFGGWKSHYTLGYNVPSYEYLYQSGNEYLLKMRAVDHIVDDMYVSELVTKIILPEGTANIKLNIPYSVTHLPDSLHFTYLDTKGRPVITFTKQNVVENHIQDFQIRYTFPRILMLQEPLLVVGFLFALFLCVIVYVRLDFSIHKSESKEHKE